MEPAWLRGRKSHLLALGPSPGMGIVAWIPNDVPVLQDGVYGMYQANPSLCCLERNSRAGVGRGGCKAQPRKVNFIWKILEALMPKIATGFVIAKRSVITMRWLMSQGDQGWMISGDNTAPGAAQTPFPF